MPLGPIFGAIARIGKAVMGVAGQGTRAAGAAARRGVQTAAAAGAEIGAGAERMARRGRRGRQAVDAIEGMGPRGARALTDILEGGTPTRGPKIAGAAGSQSALAMAGVSPLTSTVLVTHSFRGMGVGQARELPPPPPLAKPPIIRRPLLPPPPAVGIIPILKKVAVAFGALVALPVGVAAGLKRLSEGILESRRQFERFHPQIAATFAQLERQELILTARTARATAGTTTRLGERVMELKREFQPMREGLVSIGNHIAIGAAILAKWAIATMEKLPFVDDALEALREIEKSLAGEVKQPMAYIDFLNGIARGDFGQGKVVAPGGGDNDLGERRRAATIKRLRGLLGRPDIVD